MGSNSNKKSVWGSGRRGLVSENGLWLCLIRLGGEKVLWERQGVREGVVLLIFGSSRVERAHNLSNKVPLGGVEAEELDQSVFFDL